LKDETSLLDSKNNSLVHTDETRVHTHYTTQKGVSTRYSSVPGRGLLLLMQGGEFIGETELIYVSEVESEDRYNDTNGTN
jgi:hypothetical protein